MKNKIYLLTAILIFALCGLAKAHPLGNFSINQYTGVEIDKHEVRLRQFLDVAEIPTFQESDAIDADRNGTLSEAELDAHLEKISPAYLKNLLVSIDDRAVEMQAVAKRIFLRKGSGNLSTLRIEWELSGEFSPENSSNVHRLKFENRNYAGRIGWNEIVAGRTAGINVFDSTVFGSGISDELRAYPAETLDAPLAEREAEFSFTRETLPAGAEPLRNRDGHATAAVQKDAFAELIAVPRITPSIIFIGLLIAFGLGAMHALSPGHGKTVVGAYLVGSKGTPRHALFLGLTVTVTHTLGVFALGLLTLFASNYILPERLMPFLNFFSGLLVLFIGLTLFKDRLFQALGCKTDGHHHHDHDHHDHHHDHPHSHGGVTHTHGGSTHTHLPPERVTWRNLLALGISGGLLPCPSALVLMLSAISLGRIGYGLVLTLVFSIGLSATLTSVGLVFLYIGRIFENRSEMASHPLVKALPVLSSLVIAGVGAVICYRSF
ncbi:MAG: sulfite exporter TauE/SafE family protein [Pyrinomonadaceae bacterium]